MVSAPVVRKAVGVGYCEEGHTEYVLVKTSRLLSFVSCSSWLSSNPSSFLLLKALLSYLGGHQRTENALDWYK